MLRALLGLEPLDDHLIVEPSIPSTIAHIGLLGIPFWNRRNDAFGRGLEDHRGHAL
jgi:hypothetical protein